MTDLPEWLNAGAATAAAIFSYLAWRASSSAPQPEALIAWAKVEQVEGDAPYIEVRLTVRNLTEKSLFVRGISLAPTGVPLEVSQGRERDPYGGGGRPKDFRDQALEKVSFHVRPAGTPAARFSFGDTLGTSVSVRFPERTPDRIVADIVYSYGSPTGKRRKIRTNEHALDA